MNLIGIKDKKEQYLIRGALLFEGPFSKSEEKLDKATGASLIIGNQDGQNLYVYMSLDNSKPSYIGTTSEIKDIPGDYIIKHKNAHLAVFKEFKTQDSSHNERDLLNKYLQFAVLTTSKTFPTEKSLHLLKKTKQIKSLISYMHGCLAPDIDFALSNLAHIEGDFYKNK